MSDNMTKRAKEYMNSERLIKQNMEAYKELAK